MRVTLMEIELEVPLDPTPGVRPLPCLRSCVAAAATACSSWASVHSAQAGHPVHQTFRQAGG